MTGEGSTTRYIRGNGRLTASDSEKARTYYHYVSDQQGSVRYVIDSGIGKTDEAVGTDFDTLDKRVLNHYEYDAFGNLLECEERVYNPFCYTGEQYDSKTQLYYLRARYYNPVIGRFIQQEMYLGDGLNLYAYVQNNPVRYVDPSGHSKNNGVESSGEETTTTKTTTAGFNNCLRKGAKDKMNYDELVSTALKRKEIKKLLCGEKPYEVEMSKFTSDVFPTDVNAVLMNCIYKQFYNIENIREIFEDCLYEMLNEDEVHVYIACLYFDTCIFQEEQKKASFNIDKVMWASRIKSAVNRTRVELEHDIYFANGMKKGNPLKNIQNFNKYYQKNYGIEIV